METKPCQKALDCKRFLKEKLIYRLMLSWIVTKKKPPKLLSMA